MITKSKVLSFGFVLSLIALLGALTAITTAIIELESNLNFIGFVDMPVLGRIFFVFVMLIAISIYGKLLWDSNILLIDTKLKTIKFTNRLTLISSIYYFSYFDNSMIVFEPIKGGYARNYYLIKNRKVIKRITGFIYSNQNELEDALQEIKSLGEVKYSYLNSTKNLFRLPILEKGSS